MGDPLASAVADAIGSVWASLPSLSCTMSAFGMEGRAAVCSSADMGSPLATSGSVGTSFRVVAKFADFPRLEPTMPVDINGVRRIIVGLKNTGNAAWFADLSKPLEAVVFHMGTRQFTVPCAVADDYQFANNIGISGHSVTGDIVTIYIPRDDWPMPDSPAFGIRCTLEDGRIATIQAVERGEHSWKCAAVAHMREGDR